MHHVSLSVAEIIVAATPPGPIYHVTRRHVQERGSLCRNRLLSVY